MLAHPYLIRPFTMALVVAARLAGGFPLPQTDVFVDVHRTEGFASYRFPEVGAGIRDNVEFGQTKRSPLAPVAEESDFEDLEDGHPRFLS
ncbi:hypothetical protein SCHPADRAFT_910605 [Schizopora paradoxa]|uniref:Secreted protein n=1 Tax=Schizopora paradoxa TaxID=27342 RepID=A0A0H2R977_9AGAM|nr:hypothetical protein SCHPADRAFT_910605 [Schizopora paradoxa]